MKANGGSGTSLINRSQTAGSPSNRYKKTPLMLPNMTQAQCIIEQQAQIDSLVTQLANERLSREYSDKLHAREVNSINENFKKREKQLIKKYKKTKRKLTQAIEIITELKGEIGREKSDKKMLQENLERSYHLSQQKIQQAPRYPSSKFGVENKERRQLFRVPPPKPAECLSVRNLSHVQIPPSRSVNSSHYHDNSSFRGLQTPLNDIENRYDNYYYPHQTPNVQAIHQIEEIQKLKSEVSHLTNSLQDARRQRQNDSAVKARDVRHMRHMIDFVRDSSEMHRDTLIQNRIERHMSPLSTKKEESIHSPQQRKENERNTIEQNCDEFLEKQLQLEENALNARHQEIKQSQKRIDFEEKQRERENAIMRMIRERNRKQSNNDDSSQDGARATSLNRTKSESKQFSTQTDKRHSRIAQLESSSKKHKSTSSQSFIGFNSLFLGLKGSQLQLN